MSSSKEQKTQPTEENSSVEDDDLEDYAEAEEDPDLEIKELKSLIKNSFKLYKKINEFLHIANTKIKANKHKEALLFLQQSEKILEFAASCGKQLDRNLIIVVLYDSACAYQGLWQLEKCAKYLDGVIYNLESCLKDDQNITSIKASPRISDYKANRVKKLKFLILCNLQYSAILSQLSLHEKSLENAKKTWGFLAEMFAECFDYVKDLRRRHEATQIQPNPRISTSNSNPKKSPYLNSNKKPTLNPVDLLENANNTKKPNFTPVSQKKVLTMTQPSPNSGTNTNQNPNFTSSIQSNAMPTHLNESSESGSHSKSPMVDIGLRPNTVGFIKNEISFSKIVIDYAYPILEFVSGLKCYDEISTEGKEMLGEVRKSLYFWKNNPENNEKHLRKELKLPMEKDEECKRSLLGVADSTEWLETFNIGAIMHMNPIGYEEFMFYGEIIYEVSKKLLLEKVIYLSVVLFTMATEIRFIELENKPGDKKKGEGNEAEIVKKIVKNQEVSPGVKKSEILHLKAIEIACKCISCNCPYINHLITSYHKHYNQSLEIIPEESFISTTVDVKRSSPKNRESSSELYTQGTPKRSNHVEEHIEKHPQMDENNNIESSLTCLMTNSPKIKKLIKDLKNKNIHRSKKRDNPELDATQQLLLKALNENLKKSLQEKKVVNIRNSYKFVLGAPQQQTAKPSKKAEKAEKAENLKNIYKQQPTNLVGPLKNKLKNIESLLRNKFKFTTINPKNQNPNEPFKPLSARTHNEMAQNSLKSQNTNSNLKNPQGLSLEKPKKIKGLNEENLKKVTKPVPKLNLEALKKNHLEDVKFFTPREHKKMN